MSALDELSQALTSVSSAIAPSVVGIGSRLRGSGVVIADGQVLTNAHNVRGDEVTVTFAGGRTATGTVAGLDVDGDLAVIAVDTAGASAIAWSDGNGPAVGSVVFGAAATAGGGARVTFGAVSGIERSFRGPGGRRIGGSIEHTAPMAPGSSGGPLLDVEGRLVGAEHESDRRRLLPGPARRRGPARPGRDAGSGRVRQPAAPRASPLRPVASHSTSAARSGSRIVTACSSGPSRTTDRPRRPASAMAT